MSKAQVRQQIQDYRKSLSQDSIEKASLKILTVLKSFCRYKTWLIYAPIKNELSTLSLYTWLKSQNIEIYFPSVREDNLIFRKIENWNELTPGKFCPEPPEKNPAFAPSKLTESILIIPGVAFDQTGHRLGYGKGHYDKFLSQNPGGLRIGIGFDFQLKQAGWPIEAHDQKMHYIATPSGLWGSCKVSP